MKNGRNIQAVLLAALFALASSAASKADVSTLLEGKSVQIRICNEVEASGSICEEIALALTRSESELALIDPKLVVPGIDDSRMAILGRSCSPSGTDAKGDPYLPFELEYDGWQALPAGPFEIFDISKLYPKWKEHQIVAAVGYDYENRRLSTGHSLQWKGYYVVPTGAACPLVLLDAFYHRGREQASRQIVGDNLYAWQGRVLLVSAQEQPTASDRYYVTVSLIPIDPSILESSGSARRTHVASFIAQ